MFKVGDKVICVNTQLNEESKYKSILSINGKITTLTIGKQYTVRPEKSNRYETVVIDDVGNIESFYNYRFVSIPEYRKLKIEKICLKLEI